MDNTLFFYTGTGNSLWTARLLAENLGSTELIPIAQAGPGMIRPTSHVIGLVFPVHIWGVPQPVIDFINRLDADSTKYYFAVAVNAGQVAGTLIQLKKLMGEKGIKLASGFSMNLPSNYIPWGGAIAKEKQEKLFSDAHEKIKRIADAVSARTRMAPEKGPLWQNIFFSVIYHLSLSRVPKMDKPFWADDQCTACMICQRICPADNIVITGKKPVWQHHCEQCFACIQWCPAEAIQYGKSTANKRRYHHPGINLQDMLNCIPDNRIAGDH